MGAEQDCFVLSKLVGPEGFVIGVDMTQEQVSKGEGGGGGNYDLEYMSVHCTEWVQYI